MLIIAIVAVGLGLTLLRKLGPICDSRAEEFVFSFGLGLGTLALLVLGLGFAHLLYAEVMYCLLAVGVLIGSKQLIGLMGRLHGHLSGRRPDWRSFHFWLAVLIGFALLLNLLRALLPAHGTVDPLAYHLALPKIYLLKHHISFERTLTGALYPDNVGMLYLLAIGLRGAELAQVVHWSMGAATVVAIWCFCRVYFDYWVGIWAAGIYALTPVFVFYSPLCYVDIGVGFFQFMGIWAFIKWLGEGHGKSLLLAAVFMGLAMGAKHTALFVAVVLALIVVGRGLYKKEGIQTITQSLALYSLVAIGLALPWYLRAFWEAGNPVWPVANELFNGLSYKSSFSVSTGLLGGTVQSVADRIGFLITHKATSLWEWAWNEKLGWQRATGIYYIAMLPGILAYWGKPRVRWLALAALAYYILAIIYIDNNPRYNLALFALLSTVLGFVAERLGRQKALRIGLIFKVVFVLTMVGNLAQGYAFSYQAVDYAFSQQKPDQFLLENEPNYQAYRFVNKHLPSDAKVLLQGIVKGYYCERDYIWDHPFQMLLQYGDYPTTEALLERMGELGITHIVRMIRIPPGRTHFGYPQYFADVQQEDFRKKYLKLLHRDSGFVVFEVVYPV